MVASMNQAKCASSLWLASSPWGLPTTPILLACSLQPRSYNNCTCGLKITQNTSRAAGGPTLAPCTHVEHTSGLIT